MAEQDAGPPQGSDGPTEGPMVGVLARDALQAILDGGGRALRVELEDALKALLADRAVASMGVKVPTSSPTGVQADGFQVRERMRALLTRRGVRLHDSVLDELVAIASPPGVQWDAAERERATRRLVSALHTAKVLDEERPVGMVLVACLSAVEAVLDFPGVDPLRSPGLESRSTDAPPSALDGIHIQRREGMMPTSLWVCPVHWQEFHMSEPPESGICPTCTERMIRYDIEWLTRPFTPPPLDATVTRCEKCILQADQRGVPYEEVYDANHDHTGEHVGPDSSPPVEDVHVHTFEPTGRMDTGHSPPRRHYQCFCGEEAWTSDPRGPEVTP